MKMNFNVNKKYLKIVGIVIAVIIALLGIGFMAVKTFYNGMVVKEDKAGLARIPVYNRNESEVEGDINQNIAIFGVDKDEMRTDVIFVVNLNTQTDEIKVIAVPRDTKVAWTEFQQNKMEELDKGYHEYSKITEMSAYGGIDNLRYFTVNTLEDIMGLRIDHYAVVNIDAFREVVDAIGGVEVDVPRRMEYNDNYQDLHIDLQPGLQVLNGEQAEGLVRWRHNEDYSEQYAEGDVGRIETQQIFLKALAKKLLSTDTASQLLKVVNAVYSELRTDIQFNELQTYIGYANQFKLGNITFTTLPGEAVREDKWYYVLDQAEVDAFMQKILYGRDVPIIREDDVEESTQRRATSKSDGYDSPTQTEKEVEHAPEIEQEDTDERAVELPTSSPEESVTSPTPEQDVTVGEGEKSPELTNGQEGGSGNQNPTVVEPSTTPVPSQSPVPMETPSPSPSQSTSPTDGQTQGDGTFKTEGISNETSQMEGTTQASPEVTQTEEGPIH